MISPENTCRCVTCAYEWQRGQSGDHLCAKFLKTRLDYLYTVAASTVLIWSNPKSAEAAREMGMQSLKRACESETGARMGCADITPDASTLIMHEVATLVREVTRSQE